MDCTCFGGLFSNPKTRNSASIDQTKVVTHETASAPAIDVDTNSPSQDAAVNAECLQNVAAILRELTAVRGRALDQLRTATSILCDKLHAELTSVSSLSYSFDTFTVIAACGRGHEQLKPFIPQSCAELSMYSAPRVLAAGAPLAQSISDRCLALDWKLLTSDGLQWFVAVPLWRGAQVVGTMTVAFANKPVGFGTTGWLSSLEILGAWCGQWVHDGHVPLMCSFLEELSQVKDVDAFVKTVGRGLVRIAEVQLHVRLQSRVALVRGSEESALVFTEEDAGSRRNSDYRRLSTRRASGEFRKPTSSTDVSTSERRRIPRNASMGLLDDGLLSGPTSTSSNTLLSTPHLVPSPTPSKRSFTESKPVQNDAQVLGHSLPLARTLLADCLREGHGIWVADCATFLQVASNPSNDVFLCTSPHNVVSMVVAAMPPTGSHHQLLAAYLTSPTALGVMLLQALLALLEEALVLMAPLVSAKLQGEIAEEWHLVHHEALHPARATLSPSRTPKSTSSVTAFKDRATSDSSNPGDAGGSSIVSRAPTRRKVGKNQSFTIVNSGAGSRKMGPLIVGLQDKLRSYTSLQYQQFNRPEDLSGLELLEKIGAGGFGTVYHGIYSGLEVAVKLIMERGSDNQAWRDALELAVMSTLSHPNILQVLTFFTDVLVVQQGSHVVGRPSIGFKLAAEGEETEGGQRALLICMEYCDRGSLSDAIKANVFRERVSGGYGALRANLMSILHTLLEMALALRHLHSLQLVHCDVKPGNVLLKSSVTDPRGFTSKLSDFGLVKIMEEGEGEGSSPLWASKKERFSGTVTHSPPEMLVPGLAGGFVGFGADVYAFGIIMWELYTAAPVYLGMSGEEIRKKVVGEQLRPEFPHWTFPDYRELAQRCWAQNPGDRPTSEELVQVLKSTMAAHVREEGRERFRRHSSYMPQPHVQPYTRTSNPRLTRSLSDSSQFPLHIL